MAGKEYEAVKKEYEKKKPKIPRWGDSIAQIAALEKEYFQKHGKKPPPGMFKKKESKPSMKNKRKAFNQFFLEKWKTRDLKKKIKKKKAEGAKVRDKKGS